MAHSTNGALFHDTVPAVPFRSAAVVDTPALPRVDAGAAFAVLVGIPEPAHRHAGPPADLLACCAANELALLGVAGVPPALIELIVRRVSSRARAD